MGVCCVDSKKNIVVNLTRNSTFHKDNEVFSRRRSKRVPENKGGVATKRSSYFVYNNEK